MTESDKGGTPSTKNGVTYTAEEERQNYLNGTYDKYIPKPDEMPEGEPATTVRRTRVWWIVLMLVVLLVGWYVTTLPWCSYSYFSNRSFCEVSRNVRALESLTDAKIPAAPVPAAAASAPVSAPVLAEAPPPASEVARTYTVEKGDWLSLVFPNDWKAVCELNKLAHCGQIEPGQVLTLPEGVEATEKSARALKPKAAKVEKSAAKRPVATPKTNDAGEILYRVVGQAPLLNCGKRDIASISKEAWKVLGLSEEDQVYLTLNADLANGPRLNITEAEGRIDMPSGMRLEQVTFCRKGKVVTRGPYRTDWDDRQQTIGPVMGQRFKLPSGKVLVWMRNCFNWVILPEEKKEPPAPPPPPAEPPVAEIPPPALPAEPPAPVPVAEAPKGLCDRFDPHAVIGQEHEPKHDGGDHADSSFLSAALYCTWRNEADTGTHGLGFALTASEWSGTVNRQAGKYEGTMHLVGPSYEFISDDGYDYTVSAPMVGKLHERFSQDKYRSRRDFSLIGVSAGANFYQRRLAGKEWFPETQVFGTWAKPLSTAVAHSWDGQRIADTEELSRFGNYLNLGVRQWLYETPDSKVLPYAQLGYFLESPSSESMSARLGISDPMRIVGIGVGFDKDLQNGGHAVLAWGWWLDVMKGVQVGRSKYRRYQIVTEAERRGTLIEEANDGGLIIRSSVPAEPAEQ